MNKEGSDMMLKMHSIWLYHKFNGKYIFMETFLGCQSVMLIYY